MDSFRAPRTSRGVKCILWLEDSISEDKCPAAGLRAGSSELVRFYFLFISICFFLISFLFLFPFYFCFLFIFPSFYFLFPFLKSIVGFLFY